MNRRAIALICWSAASLGLVCGEAGAEPTASFDRAPTGTTRANGSTPPSAPAPRASESKAPPIAGNTPLDQDCGGASVLVTRARGLTRRGAILHALTMYSRAVALNPSCGAATLELAELRARLGDVAEAERLLARAVRQRNLAPRALKTRAMLRRTVGRNVDAAMDLQAALALRPDDLDGIRTLAGWYVEDRAWVAALTQYRALVRLLDERQRTGELDEARLRVHALMLMAAETDPVAHGATSDSWVRRSLSTLARR